MDTLKSIFFMIALMVYFKAAFGLGFGLLWSGGALIVLGIMWWGLKKMARGLRGASRQAEG